MSKGLSRGDGMVDARGVLIEPGDAVIYGFGVGRSVAMAEGRIRDDGYGHVSTTPSGRVWVTIVRRLYGGGEDERVHIAPDRLVVLKTMPSALAGPILPPSPLPTQDEVNRDEIITRIEQHSDDLAELLAGRGEIPKWAASSYELQNIPLPPENELRERAIRYLRKWITEGRIRLAEIDKRIPCCDRPGHTSPAEPRCACPCHLMDEELGLK